MTYLKSILNEVCNYNVKNPHKNMWELKPEYRHYKSNSDDEAKKKEDEGSSDDDWFLACLTLCCDSYKTDNVKILTAH